MTTIVLLNDTLRCHDNPLLNINSQQNVAVVVLDRAAFFNRQYNIPRANLQRLQQQLAAITTLKHNLNAQGIGLIMLVGDITNCLSSLVNKFKATHLYASEPTGYNEYSALSLLKNQTDVQLLDCNSLLGNALRPDLATLSHSFTPFRKQQEPLLQVSAPLSPAAVTSSWLPQEQCDIFNNEFVQLYQQYSTNVSSFPALEQQALNQVDRYIWQKKQLLNYKNTRNQLYGSDYASFCSAPLALGTLSVRWLWQNIIDFEQQNTANDSTYWLKFELLWREFFRWQCRKHGACWFSKGSIQQKLNLSAPNLNPTQTQYFNNWCAANTGVPFIDANMRLLNQTGLMSNRGRQNVASFLIHDLGIDWRLGAAYFEQRLLDYDCASNWGNWAYIAGSGNSAERQFNVIKQALFYDANGDFVRTMLPELEANGSLIHRPAKHVVIPQHWNSWLAKLS